jgi:hypothetical protein
MAVTSVLNCPALEATATMVSLRLNAEERGSAAESHRGMMQMSYFLHSLFDLFFVFSQNELLYPESGTRDDHRWVQNFLR